MRRNHVITLVFLGIGVLPAFAQRTERFAEGGIPHGGKPLLFQTLFVGTTDSTVRRVDVAYRIDLDFFIAARSGLASKGHPFVKKGELLFEMFDSTETSVARVIEPIEDSVETGASIPGVHQWHYGITSLFVPPGRYTVLTDLSDLQSKREYTDKSTKVRVPSTTGSAGVTSVFFCKGTPPSRLPDTMHLQDLGGDFLFGAPGYLATTLVGIPDTIGLRVEYSIEEAGREADPERITRHVKDAAFVSNDHCSLSPVSDTSGTGYEVLPDGHDLVIAIPLPLSQLPLRNYTLRLTVRRGEEHAEAEHHFRAVWPEMPASLRDVDQAIQALRILIPQDAVDRLDRGSFEARRDSLEAFWRARAGPLPTALNPLMAEYYKRVDVATRDFGTLRQLNGLKTDRGRIYVLYGPPSSTRRTLTPGKPYQEVWTYDRLHKTFIFEDRERNGNYVLLSTSGS
jgi:GWxTD domain-containing protein